MKPSITNDPRTPTAIHKAASQGCARLVGFLALPLLGLDINKPNKLNGESPLHLASDKGHQKTVQALLRAGANADAVDDFGNNPLFAAALRGNKAVIDDLLKAGACPWARNNNGNNPADYARAKGNHEMAMHLLRATITYSPKR